MTAVTRECYDDANRGASTGKPEPGAAKRRHFELGRIPEELTTNLSTPSGMTLRLRAIRGDDGAKLVSFHSHLSQDAIYRRYFSWHPVLSDKEVRFFTNVDYVDRVALVILDGDDIVAVGRFDRYPNTSIAETAFIVDDHYQHQGLGHQLLVHLARAAWARGVTIFSAETLSTNREMLSVFRHSGFPVTSSSSQGVVSVRFPIDPITNDVARQTARHPAAT